MRRKIIAAVIITGLAVGVAASAAFARGKSKTTAIAHVKKKTKAQKTEPKKKPSPPKAPKAPKGPRPRTTSVAPPDLAILDVAIRCPSDMVAVGGRVCVDRFEMALRDAATEAPWPPFFPPNPDRAHDLAIAYGLLARQSRPGSLGAELAIPEPPTAAITPKAVSAPGQTPQGYLSSIDAAVACESAGKRLCSEAEWVLACRGEEQRDFPYGARYEQGACNVNRESHPSFLLHGNAARYHDDPRNSLVAFEGKPLLRATGATPRCVSKWGDDEIHDMVGNLDEWVASPRGVFVGGFYSRGTKSGCRSRVSAHPNGYSDYSTGSRCCADPEK